MESVFQAAADSINTGHLLHAQETFKGEKQCVTCMKSAAQSTAWGNYQGNSTARRKYQQFSIGFSVTESRIERIEIGNAKHSSTKRVKASGVQFKASGVQWQKSIAWSTAFRIKYIVTFLLAPRCTISNSIGSKWPRRIWGSDPANVTWWQVVIFFKHRSIRSSHRRTSAYSPRATKASDNVVSNVTWLSKSEHKKWQELH